MNLNYSHKMHTLGKHSLTNFEVVNACDSAFVQSSLICYQIFQNQRTRKWYYDKWILMSNDWEIYCYFVKETNIYAVY